MIINRSRLVVVVVFGEKKNKESMFRGLLIFSFGIYTGIYLTQNYSDIPQVDAPQDLYSKFKQWCQDRLPQKHHRNRNPDDPFK